MNRTIRPVRRFRGRTTIPGDKSISHRALLLGSMAGGVTEIHGLSTGRDVQTTRACLETLGVDIQDRKGSVLIRGNRFFGSASSTVRLDAGNSGTTMRLLAGILAAQPSDAILTGDESLRARPMRRILDPLTRMGARIEAKEGVYPPLRIRGTDLRPIDYSSPLASAQVKSSILLAGLFATGETRVTEPVPSRDHTERMLPVFGVKMNRGALDLSVRGPALLDGAVFRVPGDLSSAAFLIVAATLIPDARITLKDVGINPTRTGILDALRLMGADIRFRGGRDSEGEPRADIHVRHAPLRGIVVEGAMIPRIIDEIPVLAVAATQAAGRTVVRHARELRVKETDRIHALVVNLRRMGIRIDEHEDGFVLEGPQAFAGGTVDSYGDHRIAMAFTIAGMISGEPVVIENTDCVDISYPSFFQTLRRLSHER